MNPNSIYWILLSLGAAAGWGLQYSVVEHMLKQVKASDLVTYYFCGGAIVCIFSKFFIRGDVPVPSRAEILPVSLMIVTGVLSTLAISTAIWGKTSTQASLLENAVPLFAFLFSGLLFGHWEINFRTFLGAGCIIAGVALVGSR